MLSNVHQHSQLHQFGVVAQWDLTEGHKPKILSQLTLAPKLLLDFGSFFGHFSLFLAIHLGS